LGPEHEGRFVVIDAESGDYEVSDDDGEALGRAEERHPEAVFFVLRVGPEGAPRPAHRIGGSAPPDVERSDLRVRSVREALEHPRRAIQSGAAPLRATRLRSGTRVSTCS